VSSPAPCTGRYPRLRTLMSGVLAASITRRTTPQGVLSSSCAQPMRWETRTRATYEQVAGGLRAEASRGREASRRRRTERRRLRSPDWCNRPAELLLLGLLPWHRSARFPRSAWKPEPGSRRLSAGHRSTGKQVPARLLHEPREMSDVDDSCVVFDSSSTVCLRSPSWFVPDGGTPAFSRSVHHLGSHRHAAPRGLRTGPATRPRGPAPILPCSMASVSRSI
jgi:hypothetical protein